MKVGGIMVIPVDTDNPDIQQMKKITKTEDGFHEEVLEDFNFVPMLKGKD